MPAAAITPAWRMPPPQRARNARASAITAAGPHNSEPTGAPSPFDRQNMTVSTGATRSRGAVPSAMAAFQMRAPSIWTGNPPDRAMSHSVTISGASIGAPDSAMYVFSITTSEGLGR